jgi:hypothetical protein
MVVGPVVGLVAALKLPNPPGNGPGAGQVAAGILVPVAVVALAALATRARPAEALFWAVIAPVVTGGVVLFLMWLAFAVTGGQ